MGWLRDRTQKLFPKFIDWVEDVMNRAEYIGDLNNPFLKKNFKNNKEGKRK